APPRRDVGRTIRVAPSRGPTLRGGDPAPARVAAGPRRGRGRSPNPPPPTWAPSSAAWHTWLLVRELRSWIQDTAPGPRSDVDQRPIPLRTGCGCLTFTDGRSRAARRLPASARGGFGRRHPAVPQGSSEAQGAVAWSSSWRDGPGGPAHLHRACGVTLVALAV